MKNVKYTFGTSARAAERLGEIARYFNPLAAALIRQFVTRPPAVALDLGCGPGFTTNMLSEATGCSKVYGLDNSPEFLDLAGQRFPHCTFLRHDVTRGPFPVTANVMYSRFVLCHLPSPLDTAAVWLTQIKSGGLLFIDEVDAIATDLEVFTTYIAVAEGIIATQGACLFVGKILESAEYDAEVLLNEAVTLPVADRDAASWFFSNTQTVWKDNEYVLDRLSAEERNSVARELQRLTRAEDSDSNITWKLRRLVLRKRAA